MDESSSSPGSHEDGWTWVSQRMGSKDGATMKGFSDDIDSLLVLDGLFSAVVTGFVVVAISMLQEDSGQTSAQLLSTISTQLSSLTLSPPYINSTITAPSPSPSFQPTSAARWINSLWFISLVLSLASAVLGILAKQWIREYLQWQNSTSTPRENVLLREIRSEAWDSWHAAALISAVPVLLELAVLLFTCGLSVYVWAVDVVVGVVVTICVGLFLLLVASLTILPAICKHCPYKSPTAWAFTTLLLWFAQWYRHVLRRFLLPSSPDVPCTPKDSIISKYNEHFQTIHSVAYLRPEARPSWRLRDLHGAQIQQLRDSTGDMTSAHLILHKDLQFELRDATDFVALEPFNDTPAGHMLPNDLRISPAALRAYVATVSEADLLFKGLVKFVMEITNSDALHNVAQCVQTMFTSLSCNAAPHYIGPSSDVRLAELALDGAFHNIAVWYMLSRLDSTRPGYMGAPAYHPSAAQREAQQTLLTSVLRGIRRSVLDQEPRRDESCAFLPPDDEAGDGLAEYEESPMHDSQHIVMNYVLSYTLQALIIQMLHPSVLDLAGDHAIPQLLHCRADELLCALRLVTFYWDSMSQLRRACRRDCARVLVKSFNTVTTSPLKARFDASFPTLRTQMFFLLSLCNYPLSWAPHFTLHLSERSVEDDHSDPTASSIALATCYSDVDLAGLSEEEMSIFSQVVNYALADVHRHTPADIGILCDLMIASIAKVRTARQEGTSLHILHETWTGRLIQTRPHRRDKQFIVLAMLQRAPDSALRLLHGLHVDFSDDHMMLARSLVNVLLVAQGLIPLPKESSPSAADFPASLEGSTTLLVEWPMDVDDRAEPWLQHFLWAASHWIWELMRGPRPISTDGTNLAHEISAVLRKMTYAIQQAVLNEWVHSSQWAVALWLKMLSSSEPEAPLEHHTCVVSDDSLSLAEVLSMCAPDDFQILLDTLHAFSQPH